MTLDAHVERHSYLEVEFYEETPEVSRNSRGLGEASVVSVRCEAYDDLLVEVRIGETVYYVPREVLREMAGA